MSSLASIRSAFPALERTHAGHPVAYFDGPGGTQVPRTVVDAMSDYLFHHNANTHWDYPTSHETDAMIAGARAAYAELFNGAPEEVVFGNNMTSLAFHVSRALGRGFRDVDGQCHAARRQLAITPEEDVDDLVLAELVDAALRAHHHDDGRGLRRQDVLHRSQREKEEQRDAFHGALRTRSPRRR